MNFQLISDLHGRINRMEINKNADILLFAGDSSENLDVSFKMIKSSPIPVLYVPGNHDAYHKDYSDTYMRIKDFCDKSNGNAIFLDNEVVEIDDYQIIGSTLWSDFFNLDPFLLEASWGSVNDYRCIQTLSGFENFNDEILSLHELHCHNIKSIMLGDDEIKKKILSFYLDKRLDVFNKNQDVSYIDLKKFSPYHSYILNVKSKNWLKNILRSDFNGKRIVMTHHAPSYTPLILGGYVTNPFEVIKDDQPFLKRRSMLHKIGAYCNSMESLLLESHVDTWVHGHFHEHLNYRMGSANVICNATGNNKLEDMSFRNYIFNCSDFEKNQALKSQLNLFYKPTLDLFNFLNLLSTNSYPDLNLRNLYALRGYWREIEIILNSIHSLPYTEIHSSFHNYYPDPFSELHIDNWEVLSDSDFKNIIKKIMQELKFIGFGLNDWFLSIKSK